MADLLFKWYWWVFSIVATLLSWLGAWMAEGAAIAVIIASTVTAAAGGVTWYRKYVSDHIRLLRKSLWQLTRSGIETQMIINELKEKIEWGTPATLMHLKNRMVYGLHRESTSPHTLRGWNLSIYLPLAKLTGVSLAGMDLRRGLFVQADLQNANLEGADLRQASLDGANLTEANLKGANLHEASLKGANVTRVVTDENTKFPNDALPYGYGGLERFTQGTYTPDSGWPKPHWRNW